MLEHDHLLSILEYDPETGIFTNLIRRGPAGDEPGTEAGYSDKDGYIIIQINKKKYKAHRLAWFYMIGQWPVYEIDHKDGCPAHNIWSNLREATRVENVINSDREPGESGFRGVKFDPRTRTWRARIGRGHQRKYIGAYDTAEEAYQAYLATAEEVHGEYASHNRNLEHGAT